MARTKEECQNIKSQRKHQKMIHQNNKRKEIEQSERQLDDYQHQMRNAKESNDRQKVLFLLNLITNLRSELILKKESLTKTRKYGFTPTPIRLEYNFDRQLLKMYFDYVESNQLEETVPQ